MRPTLLFVLLLTLISPLCLAEDTPITPSLPAASNAFGLELFAKLSASTPNLFFSPYGIHSALAIVEAGAAGQTARQMVQVLHVNPDSAKLAAAYAALNKALILAPGKDQPYQLTVANDLWGQQGTSFRQPYIDLVTNQFQAGFAALNFSMGLGQAIQTINATVARQTDNKVPNLIGPNVLKTDTRLVVTNAVYFNSPWQFPFTPDATQLQPFRIDSGDYRTAVMMHGHQEAPYAETPEFQLLEIPYAANRLGLLIILPRSGTLADLEKNLTAENLDKWVASLRRRSVNMAIPKFKFAATFDLGATLSDMGMADAFGDQADFSAMAAAEKLHIGKVMHQAFVEVEEQGTEAAAATAVAMAPMAMPAPDEPPVNFMAYHPFFFFIRHRSTNTILFMGRLAEVPQIKQSR